MNESTRTRLLAIIGGGTLITAALVVGVTTGPGEAVAGGGNEPHNTYVQKAGADMTTGATATVGPAPASLATSVASPTFKAVPLGPECNTSGQCP